MNLNANQGNQCWTLNIKVHSALLGCAKEKITENPDYFFRIQFEYKSAMDLKDGVKVKTSQQKLKETEMAFNEEVTFSEVNIEEGLIEIRMLIGTLSIGRRFNSSIIMLRDLIVNREDRVIWKFSANSIIDLTYQLKSNTKLNEVKKIDGHLAGVQSNSSSSLILESSLGNTLSKPFSEYSSQNIQRESQMRGSLIKDKVHSIERTLKKANSSSIHTSSKINERVISRTQSQKITNAIQELHSSEVEPNLNVKNFCEGFFLASFPANNGQIIENSKSFVSSCKHKVCSMLPAMEPEILYRYPFEDSKELEMNNLAASICFPSGVKICYEQKIAPVAPKNYLTQITNEKGDRYYMMTYHYYLKMEYTQYNKEYSTHPLKYFLKKFGENYYDILDISEEDKAVLEDELDICGELGFSEFVHIPFALVLIARFPYAKAMESCLNSMMQILINNKDNASVESRIAQIVSFLITSVPLPQSNAKVVFSLPYEPSPIEVEGPVYKDKFLSDINLDILFNKFSIDHIIEIYRLMLLEQKILFVDKEYCDLSNIIAAFVSLLFPIEWVHTNIPIMSDKMTRYLQTFLPFISGINENLLSLALSSLSEADEGVFIVYCYSNTICNSKTGQKEGVEAETALEVNEANEGDDDIEANLDQGLPVIPGEIEETLRKKLLEIRGIKAKALLNLCIRNSFIEAFSALFFDFKDYLYKLEDFTVFDTKMLLDNRKKEEHAFYKEITERQLFINFIQNISKNEEDYTYFMSILSSLKSNEQSTCLNKLKHASNQTEVIYSYLKHNSIHFTFIIQPPFCHLNTLIGEEELQKSLQLNFGLTQLPSKVIEETLRIVSSPLRLAITDYPSIIQRYNIPGFDKDSVKKRLPTIFVKVDALEKNIERNKTQSIIERSKKESELSEKQKEDIKDIIKDALFSIFQSKVDINTTPVLQEIYRSFGRECFCSLVSQTDSIKKIQPDCFNQLVKLFLNGFISMCNINENDTTLDCAVQLTKSSFFYCKGNTGDFLYDELKMKLKDYFLWVKDSFWLKWLDTELKERRVAKGEKEQSYLNLIEQICDKMLKLQINKEYIIKFINSLLEMHLAKNPSFEDIRSNINKQIGKFKYFEVNLIKQPMSMD